MTQEFSRYVRSLVRGDTVTNDEVGARLDATGWDGFARYQTALFFLVVGRRFGRTVDDSKIIRFVADLRADLGPGGPEIDAAAAEALIRATIDEALDYDIPPAMIGTIQATTIYKVLTDDPLPNAELDVVLSTAEAIVGSVEAGPEPPAADA